MKKNLRIRLGVVSLIVICSLMIVLTASSVTQTQMAAEKLSVQPALVPDDTSMTKEEIVKLIEEKLAPSLQEAVEDEDMRAAITAKWEEKIDDLVGKTKTEVIESLFEDVKAEVTDAEKTDKLWENWNAAETTETTETNETDESEVDGAGGAPNRDMKRFNAMKKTPMPSQKWTFNVKAGQITFWYENSTGYASFKPNKTVGNAPIAWIQVVRTGGKDRWYSTVGDINAFSKNNANYVLRTDPVYGFRVDKTKDENVPFYDQTTIKIGETLNTYKLAFDIPDRSTTSGGVINFSDQPQPGQALLKVKAVDKTTTEYRMYFLLSPINTQTGEIYGTVEWALAAALPTAVTTALAPSLITKDIPEFKGRDLAFERWNTIVSKQYTPMPSVPASTNARTVYPVPGKGKFWMK